MDEAAELRERAARLFALAIALREHQRREAEDYEQMANEQLAKAEAIERDRHAD